jgi:hypothetical protein
MQALGGYVWGELRGAIDLGVKRALAVVASHYEIDLEWVRDGYVLPDEPKLITAEMWRLNDDDEGPSHPALEGKPNVNLYVPGSETHVHSDYIIGHHHTLLKVNSRKVLYYIKMPKTSTESIT